MIEDWAGLRSAMRKHVPEEFSRDEWAYLMAFLAPENLRAPFVAAFGTAADQSSASRLARPRGAVGVWLPNNVSLLGPLTLILLSLTGNRLLLKGGSRGTDLAGPFLDFARRWAPDGALRSYLAANVEYAVFDHSDIRHRTMLDEADVRIVFGSDAACSAIQKESSFGDTVGFSFLDRQSQAWIENGAATDDVLRNLIRVFAIYGRAGCTSPHRVVLLDGTHEQAQTLKARILALWPEVFRFRPPQYVASGNTLAQQWAAACGWEVALVVDRQAVVGVADLSVTAIDSPMFLAISPAPMKDAVASLPPSIQTLGHAFQNPQDPKWLMLAASTSIKRLVPIARMHHFGALWDGHKFWEQCFEEVEIGT
jgi:hypothetical protein